MRLHQAFARMLERLEAERRRASSAALTAQEQERARVARDLHDEVNQSLTGLLLRLEATREKAPPELAGELAEIRARGQPGDAGAARPRPPAAPDRARRPRAGAGRLPATCASSRARGSTPTFEAEGDLGRLPEDVQLVVYRVAQEALSNAVRHSEAEHVQVELRREGDGVALSVARRRARIHASTRPGAGSESAACASARCWSAGEFQIESRPGVGTRVRLLVPITEDDDAGERGLTRCGC